MFKDKTTISVIRIVKNNSFRIFERTKHILKKYKCDKLLTELQNQFSSGQEIYLFNKIENNAFIKNSRYLYLKISVSTQAQISFWWRVNDQKFTTRDFGIDAGTAIYEFSLTSLRARDRINYFLNENITSFGIKCDKDCSIELVKFTKEKISLKNRQIPFIEVIDYPNIVHLEVTRNCNIKCYMCRENRDEEVRQIGTNDLDCQLLDKMIPFMQNVTHVALFGWGEPFCHQRFDKFIDVISKIKERNIPKLLNKEKPFVNTTTNATLFTVDLLARFIKNGLDEVIVSMDSPNEKNFNFIRKGASFKNVVANLRMLQELKNKHGVSYPALTIEFVAMRRNIEELTKMIQFAIDLGAKRMTVYYITVVTKGLEHESLYYHQDLANRIFDEAEQLASAKGFMLHLPPRFGTRAEPQGYCNDVLEMFYVRAEGTVIPCCIATDYIIGNLYEESPEAIWQGERRKKIIDNLRNGILEGKCKNCYKFTGNDINLRETHIKV